MVVVPTENQVTLSYGRSPLEWLGILATLVGVGLVLLLMALDHRRGAAAATSSAEPAPGAEDLAPVET
jgi:hypothetical protein